MRYLSKISVSLLLATALIVVTITVVYDYEFNLLPGSIYNLLYQEDTRWKGLNNPYEITIVTMYVNIGAFSKGGDHYRYTTEMYKNWMGSWAGLTNRVIGFFADDEIMEHFRKIRSVFPEDRTLIKKINRNDLSTFQNLDKVRQIFKDPSYPKHKPNTVVPEYSCATGAKYEALDMAIAEGHIQTKYVAWLDIGLFRNLVSPANKTVGYNFTLEVPAKFNSSCVSVTEVSSRDQMSKFTPREYIWSNHVWVAGGFVLGTIEVMKQFSDSFKRMAKHLLDQNLASTDQQVIGAMYSPDYIHQQKVDVCGYSCKEGQFGLYSSDCQYFCFAYICKDAAERRRNGSLNE